MTDQDGLSPESKVIVLGHFGCFGSSQFFQSISTGIQSLRTAVEPFLTNSTEALTSRVFQGDVFNFDDPVKNPRSAAIFWFIRCLGGSVQEMVKSRSAGVFISEGSQP